MRGRVLTTGTLDKSGLGLVESRNEETFMKVLHVLNHSVPHMDGYCVRSENIVQFQKKMGWDPVVVTSPHQEPIPSDSVETIQGIRYYRVVPHRRRRFPIAHEIVAMHRLQNRILEVASIERPALVHAHSPSTWGAAGWLAARRLNLPFVYEVRGLWQGQIDQRHVAMRHRLGRRLESSILRRSVVATISDGLRTDIIERGAHSDRVFAVPNGVDLDGFRPRAGDAELLRDLDIAHSFRMGYIGSLYDFEGIDDLVRAMSIIREHVSNARLFVLGAGPREKRIRELVDELGLSDVVQLVGRVPHSDVTRYYSIMDMLVYPRKRNRTTDAVTPLKPLEAMAMAKAIVASDVGGLRELLGDQCCKFFKAGDINDLAEQCIRLATSPDLCVRLGENARQHVVRTRDWAQLIEYYKWVYDAARVEFTSRKYRHALSCGSVNGIG